MEPPNTATLVEDMVKQASTLPYEGRQALKRQWRKRATEHAGFAKQFDKNAQFTSRDLALVMERCYNDAAEALHAETQDPE